MKLIHGLNPVDFDLQVAIKYRNKATDAKSRGLDFKLTLLDFRRLMQRQRCDYTGRQMTFRTDTVSKQLDTDLTVERIDNNEGYVPGNCIAVCKAANAFKSVLENPSCTLDIPDAIRMFAAIDRMQKERK